MLVSDACGLDGEDPEVQKVLILVLVDVGLGPPIGLALTTSAACLNPCFSGCWSRTGSPQRLRGREVVLILVLVDVGLGQYTQYQEGDDWRS